MDKSTMRNEVMTVMIRKMKDEMNWRPRWVLSEIRAPYTDAHIARFKTGLKRTGGEVFVKMKCKYCSIIFSVATFEQIEHIQETQCYITMNGVNHSLKAVLE